VVCDLWIFRFFGSLGFCGFSGILRCFVGILAEFWCFSGNLKMFGVGIIQNSGGFGGLY